MEITRHGTAIMTNGTPTAIGEKLPVFTVKDAQGQSLTTQDLSRRLTLISVVPDINTRVCSISTKHFNEDMDAFDNVDFYTISTNTLKNSKHGAPQRTSRKCSYCPIKMLTLGKPWDCLLLTIILMPAVSGLSTTPAPLSIAS